MESDHEEAADLELEVPVVLSSQCVNKEHVAAWCLCKKRWELLAEEVPVAKSSVLLLHHFLQLLYRIVQHGYIVLTRLKCFYNAGESSTNIGSPSSRPIKQAQSLSRGQNCSGAATGAVSAPQRVWPRCGGPSCWSALHGTLHSTIPKVSTSTYHVLK